MFFVVLYIIMCIHFLLITLTEVGRNNQQKKSETHKADSIMIIMFVEWGGTAECKTMQNVLVMDLAFAGK